MSDVRILWADDEIDHLKPQIMFLESKGYVIEPVTNGYDAIEKCKKHNYDVVFLDESMPGIGGLDTLTKIKEIDSAMPVVMITKNEEENIMEEAIGAQITDYLIKPVKSNQILLTLKRILDNKRLVSNATNSAYQQEFAKIFSAIQTGLDHEEWKDLYRKLVYWELELENTQGKEMMEVMAMQKQEANNEFSKYIAKNYLDWINSDSGPVMSHQLFKKKIFPKLHDEIPTIVVVIDNLRYDQWKIIQPILSQYFRLDDEDLFYSILPTSTQYARNAIFAGMRPLDIEKSYPKLWRNESDEGGKNMFEKELLELQLKRYHRPEKFSYSKVTNNQAGKTLVDNIHNMLNNPLNVIVYNFVDMLSHARTELEVLKELASDESAYRSITQSWIEHSPLLEALKRISDKKVKLVITTDHGTMRVQNPIKVVGDKNTTTNLRYKMGRNLNYKASEVFEITDPAAAGLPRTNISSRYIFTKNNDFFVYPNNYNHYVKYYKDTFQHGGISLEEVIIPIAYMSSK